MNYVQNMRRVQRPHTRAQLEDSDWHTDMLHGSGIGYDYMRGNGNGYGAVGSSGNPDGCCMCWGSGMGAGDPSGKCSISYGEPIASGCGYAIGKGNGWGSGEGHGNGVGGIGI